MTFRIGQKVTLKYPHKWIGLQSDEVGPVFGDIYTIRGIETEVEGLFLAFEEIVNPSHWSGPVPDCTFWSRHFRPVVERRTDISVFTDILRKATKPARTPAMSQHHRGSENV